MKTNIIYNEDCLIGMKKLSDESIDLIYIDPPFNSGQNYGLYDDKWNEIESYIRWIKLRVKGLYRVLKPTGSFYLHCDWHANAHLRIMLDKIFGEKNFRNEIIWCYSGGGIPKKDFPRKHDVIFRYTKLRKDYTFNPQYRPYTKGTIERGRTRVKGEHAKLNPMGTPVQDWWTDIPKITSPTDPEKLGYPTQKSEALLERIIKTSSNKGDIILDAFCGCGTTLVVAHKLERNWIGIDISSTAVKLANKRLAGVQLSLI